ncbi:MAG: anthranilate synthase component II [Bacilli bacterium]
MILLIDNYDSFTYNLYQAMAAHTDRIEVVRNDAITVDEIKRTNPSAIVLSPGPGHPREAGVCMDVVKELAPHFPILGICLGHQAIVEAFGGVVTYSKRIMHGKTSAVVHDGVEIYADVPNETMVMRYHSLAAEEATLPSELEVTARSTDDNTVMSVRHTRYPTYGIQFHPESFMTEQGEQMLVNFIKMSERVKHDA